MLGGTITEQERRVLMRAKEFLEELYEKTIRDAKEIGDYNLAAIMIVYANNIKNDIVYIEKLLRGEKTGRRQLQAW